MWQQGCVLVETHTLLCVCVCARARALIQWDTHVFVGAAIRRSAAEESGDFFSKLLISTFCSS